MAAIVTRILVDDRICFMCVIVRYLEGSTILYMTPALAVALGTPVAKKYSSPTVGGGTEKDKEGKNLKCNFLNIQSEGKHFKSL